MDVHSAASRGQARVPTERSQGVRRAPPARPGRQPSRRNAILQAAMDLFAKGGSRGTCIAAIAARIGVTPAAVIHHFGTKDALLLEVVAEIDRRRPSLVTDPDGVSGADALRRLGEWGSLLEQDGALANLARLATVMVAEGLDPDHPSHDYFVRRAQEFRLAIAPLVRAGQLDGSIRRDVDPVSVATQVVALVQGVQIQWFLEPDQVPIGSLLDDFFAVFLDGLAPPASGRPGGRRVPRGQPPRRRLPARRA
ncbi:MAG TPA: TetR/AcrR family transcriptional regulator [Acidimicrobiales bacterium]|nr:TetR/AcrR family transcriptional regulator [Acidimicrobiales bacterium]